MASAWKYSRDGHQKGPVSTAQLKQSAASGELLSTDLIWKEGMEEWVPARRLKGLFAPAAVPAQPIIPPPPPPLEEPTSANPDHPACPAPASATVEGAAGVPQWFYTKDDQPQGPVTVERLRELATSGDMHPSDLVWTEGIAQWLPAGEVKTLAGIVGPIATASPPLPASLPAQPNSTPQMPSVSNLANAAGPDAPRTFGSLGDKMKAFGRESVARAKKAHAAVPNRIKIGKFAIPKLAVYGVVALALIVTGWLMFRGPSRHGGVGSGGSTEPTWGPGGRQTAKMSTDEFTKAAAKLLGEETWGIRTGGGIREGYFLHGIASNDRISSDRWEAAVGKPDEVHDIEGWNNQEWVYRLSDGFATLRIMDFRMMRSYGSNLITVCGPGIVLGPRPVFLSGPNTFSPR